MTWNFGVNEFGWSYQFDDKSGLVIQSSNPKVTEISLPVKYETQSGYDLSNDWYGGEMTYADGYYYYSGDKGVIYSSLKEKKKVYQLEPWSYGDGEAFVSHGVTNENGEAFLRFHQGGAVMGSDHEIKLNSDRTHCIDQIKMPI